MIEDSKLTGDHDQAFVNHYLGKSKGGALVGWVCGVPLPEGFIQITKTDTGGSLLLQRVR